MEPALDLIYLDNNATTRPAPEVFDAMRPFLDASFGNPSSAYSLGREARRTIENSRETLAQLIGARSPTEIAFTSGGTESDNWAITGSLQATGKRHIITTLVEHDAVRKLCRILEATGVRVTWLEVDRDGALDLDALREAISDDTAVVSTMLANNETGVLFPVEQIGEIVKTSSNAIFHVDGVNAVGKIPIDLSGGTIDVFSLSAHKFHGPKGIGALYIREGLNLPPLLTGGGQEAGRRAGTEAVHQIAGMGAAAALAMDLTPLREVEILRDRLESEILLKIPNAFLNGSSEPSVRLPNTSNISFEHANGEIILHELDALGIAVSSGSACNSSDHTASPVLQAMGIPYTRAMGAIRFSLGRFNTDDDVDRVLEVLPEIIATARKFSDGEGTVLNDVG